jgi:hypothetical protein
MEPQAQQRLSPAAGAADQCPQPRQQLFHVKRLDQIIVGAGFQPFDLVLPATASGENQDGEAPPRRPPAADHFDPRQIRQAEIHHRRVQRIFLAEVQTGATVGGGVHGVALLA